MIVAILLAVLSCSRVRGLPARAPRWAPVITAPDVAGASCRVGCGWVLLADDSKQTVAVSQFILIESYKIGFIQCVSSLVAKTIG